VARRFRRSHHQPPASVRRIRSPPARKFLFPLPAGIPVSQDPSPMAKNVVAVIKLAPQCRRSPTRPHRWAPCPQGQHGVNMHGGFLQGSNNARTQEKGPRLM